MKNAVLLLIGSLVLVAVADRAVWHYMAHCDVDSPGNGFYWIDVVFWGPASLAAGVVVLVATRRLSSIRSGALLFAFLAEALVAMAWPVSTAMSLHGYPSEGEAKAWYCWRAST